MRTPVFMLIVCQSLTGAQQIKIEHLAGGNMVSVTDIKGSDSTKIYRAGKPSQQGGRLLLTHHRRDIVPPIPQDAHVVAPREEEPLFSKTEDYWNAMSQKRFHYYTQQSTKVLVKPVKVKQWVSEGDIVESAGIKFRVVATPGFTRGAISYFATIEGKRCAFTGDLIYGDGKIFDLYSFQDAIPEAKVGGYHGYGGRLADLVTSLRKIKAWKPEVIYPAPPVIRTFFQFVLF